MGRRKQYDPAEKLREAMQLFHENGFQRTTPAELADSLSMNRKSLYAEFGSKAELFDAALELYQDAMVPEALACLEGPSAGLDGLRLRLEFLATAGGSAEARMGCLMCNTLSERAWFDEGNRAHGDRYLRRMDAAFRNALGNAVERGELRADIDVAQQAAFFTNHNVGQLILLRSGAAPELVATAAAAALSHLESLRP